MHNRILIDYRVTVTVTAKLRINYLRL